MRAATGSARRPRARSASRRRRVPRRRRRARRPSAAGPSPSGRRSTRPRAPRARGSARRDRASSSSGRPRSAAGRARRVGSSRRSVRIVAPSASSAAAGSDGCAEAQKLVPEERVLAMLPVLRVAAVAAVQVAGEIEPPVPAAGGLEQVAADRAHVAELGRGGQPARLAESRGDLRIEPRAPRASCRRRSSRPEIPRGSAPRDVDEPSAVTIPSRQQRHELRAARERATALRECRDSLLRRARPLQLQQAPSLFRASASRSARRISSRVIGSEVTSAPVASRIAFAIAAAVGTIGGSPRPFEPRFVRCSSGTSTRSQTISGTSAIVGSLYASSVFVSTVPVLRVVEPRAPRTCARAPG